MNFEQLLFFLKSTQSYSQMPRTLPRAFELKHCSWDGNHQSDSSATNQGALLWPLSKNEVLDAISMASGSDGIPTEVLKHSGPKLICHIHSLLGKIWDREIIPAELRDAPIGTIIKKGDKVDCTTTKVFLSCPQRVKFLLIFWLLYFCHCKNRSSQICNTAFVP